MNDSVFKMFREINREHFYEICEDATGSHLQMSSIYLIILVSSRIRLLPDPKNTPLRFL